MYLKSLTLKGFKSFAQATTFAFEPGVTAIVGPNGSGKSNVVDALAWVMGEQGAKSLRGGKMEDVIFAGTSTRGPLGRAEVSLTIDNTDGALPIDYTEVTITRTLFRNGQSEYAINGSGCRLLDVQELLSDSGLGREMHVIVGQGRLDSVLHASPEERRGFIEEAAGILKHRRRKEKAVRKLEAMQANFNRLNDLAGELRRQLKPLGRQADLAREAASVAAVARDAKARLIADEMVSLGRTLAEQVQHERDCEFERGALQERLAETVATVARLDAEQAEDGLDAVRATCHALEYARTELRALGALARQRVDLLTGELERPDVAATVFQEDLDAVAQSAADLADHVRRAEQALLAAREDVVAIRGRLDAADVAVAGQSARVVEYDEHAHRLASIAATAASALAAVRIEVDRHGHALTNAAERADHAAVNLAQVEAVNADASASDTDLDAAYDTSQRAVTAAEQESERLREALHEAEREREALGAAVRALSLALDTTDGSAKLLAARLPDVKGALADVIRVEPGFEAAIAVALGPLAEAVVVTDHAAGLRTLTAATGFGRVALAVAQPAAPPPDPIRVPGLTAADDVIEAPDGIRALLRDVLIADDLAAADAVAAALAALPHPATVVTRDGTVIGRYVLVGGTGRAQSRIELRAERERAEARAVVVRDTIERTRTELVAQRAALDEAKQRSRATLQALRDHDAALARRADAFNRVRIQSDAAAAEADRLRQALASAQDRAAAAMAAADAATADQERAAAVPRPILDVTERDGIAAELEQGREREVAAALECETSRERVRAERAREEALQRQFATEQKQVNAAAERAAERAAQLRAAERVLAVIPLAVASVDASVQEAMAECERFEVHRASRTHGLTTARAAEAEMRSRLTSVTENVHGLELRIHEQRLQFANLLERAESEFALTEQVLLAEFGPEVPVPPDTADADPVPFEREEQRQRLARAERVLAQLGRVNPLALEEFAALEERHAFLSAQLTDLQETRRDLLAIVEELDTTMHAIFVSAFEDTRAAFAEVFPILFPGGVGSISLTDPDDPLTTGIEVSVRPAGKRIERLSLLSGGERSLAAVALLLAIFTARPSPFYIMDEVEAALDDANLGRLLTTFESLRDHSQLIVVTHQKRTMEIADALYGVSMRSDGISAVVGQRVREGD